MYLNNFFYLFNSLTRELMINICHINICSVTRGSSRKILKHLCLHKPLTKLVFVRQIMPLVNK